MITIRNLRKRHGDRMTLDGADAEIGAGETVAIVGPSGGGKTTLLRCLNALERFDSGSIRIADRELGPTRLPAHDLVALRTAVGMVFQELNLFSHLTVLDNVALAPRVVGKVDPETAAQRARALLERVGLGERASAYPHELSGGQKQRVAIVRALAQAPKVLLLDEPTSALDPATAADVANTITDLTHGRVTVVIVTHHLELAHRLADRILELDHGRLEPHARRHDAPSPAP